MEAETESCDCVKMKSRQLVTKYLSFGMAIMVSRTTVYVQILHLVLRCLCEPKSRAAVLWDEAQKALSQVSVPVHFPTCNK